MSLRDGVLVVEGWCIPSETKKIEFFVTDRSGKPMNTDRRIRAHGLMQG